jgi:hypothetical protein
MIEKTGKKILSGNVSDIGRRLKSWTGHPKR